MMSELPACSILHMSTLSSETPSCHGGTMTALLSGLLGWFLVPRQVLINGLANSPLNVSMPRRVCSLPKLTFLCADFFIQVFFNKSSKAMPYISAPYRNGSVVNTLRSYVAQVPIVPTGNRVIDLAPFPSSISSFGTVKFLENGRPEAEVMRIKAKTLKPDMVVLATGYTQSFQFLSSSYPLPSSADIRGVWKAGQEDVAFIGFLRPSFGAIPPLAELQAQLWVLNLLGRLPAPLSPQDHYKLHHLPGSRVKYGVDHESYAYQLACDMGSAASFSEVLGMGWKVAVTWALSAQVNTKFRLTGPWKWDGAKQVMETEIWETVSRRRNFFGHFTLSFMPIVLFGTLSAILYVLEQIWGVLKFLWKRVTLS